MTRQEFNDLYDSLYYGHEAELELRDRRYFIEWNEKGVDIYALNGDRGEKIATISAEDKREILAELFNYKFDVNINLNDTYNEIILVDIE